jgi:hypothetical protein
LLVKGNQQIREIPELKTTAYKIGMEGTMDMGRKLMHRCILFAMKALAVLLVTALLVVSIVLIINNTPVHSQEKGGLTFQLCQNPDGSPSPDSCPCGQVCVIAYAKIDPSDLYISDFYVCLNGCSSLSDCPPETTCSDQGFCVHRTDASQKQGTCSRQAANEHRLSAKDFHLQSDFFCFEDHFCWQDKCITCI